VGYIAHTWLVNKVVGPKSLTHRRSQSTQTLL
jgi:hypothetical protein